MSSVLSKTMLGALVKLAGVEPPPRTNPLTRAPRVPRDPIAVEAGTLHAWDRETNVHLWVATFDPSLPSGAIATQCAARVVRTTAAAKGVELAHDGRGFTLRALPLRTALRCPAPAVPDAPPVPVFPSAGTLEVGLFGKGGPVVHALAASGPRHPAVWFGDRIFGSDGHRGTVEPGTPGSARIDGALPAIAVRLLLSLVADGADRLFLWRGPLGIAIAAETATHAWRIACPFDKSLTRSSLALLDVCLASEAGALLSVDVAALQSLVAPLGRKAMLAFYPGGGVVAWDEHANGAADWLDATPGRPAVVLGWDVLGPLTKGMKGTATLRAGRGPLDPSLFAGSVVMPRRGAPPPDVLERLFGDAGADAIAAWKEGKSA